MSADERLTPHAEVNRRLWDELSDEYQQRHGGQLEKSGGTAWGVWQIPESQLQILGDVDRAGRARVRLRRGPVGDRA